MIAPELEPTQSRTLAPSEAAFVTARRWFLDGRRLEMTRLAGELGVSRVTLNRWLGSRDLLLADVIWSLASPTLEALRASASDQRNRPDGAGMVADMIAGLLEATLAAPYMASFLRREPDIALRVLTTDRTPFQHRVVEWMTNLIDEVIPAEQLPLPGPDLGYLVVRIGESFGYVDLIAGGTPDPAKARAAIAALLRHSGAGLAR